MRKPKYRIVKQTNPITQKATYRIDQKCLWFWHTLTDEYNRIEYNTFADAERAMNLYRAVETVEVVKTYE